MNCEAEDLECYLLDDNGYIIVSEKLEDTGKFFGEIDGVIMDSLRGGKDRDSGKGGDYGMEAEHQSPVFDQVRVYDYQAICLHNIIEGNMANILITVSLST